MTPKPFPYSLRIKVERLPVRNRMTAILSLTFIGGVLMMADTEETLTTDAKSSCDKLIQICIQVWGYSWNRHHRRGWALALYRLRQSRAAFIL